MTKKKKIVLGFLVVVFTPIILLMIWHKLSHYYLPPFKGRVIDSYTKEPVEGAAVLAVYYKTTWGIAGSNTIPFDARESLTDAKGEFKIPMKSGWFGEISGEAEADLTIFKPGYGVYPDHKRSAAVGGNKSWPPPKKYVVYEMPKLNTLEERKKNLSFRQFGELPLEKRKDFAALIDHERINLGFEPLTIPKKK